MDFNRFLQWLRIIRDWIDTNSDLLTVAATIAIAYFTFTLYRATSGMLRVARDQSKDMKDSIAVAQEAANAAKDSAKVARDALTSTQRAFVFLKDIKFRQTRDPGDYSIIAWQFFPQWENSGGTATKNLTISVGARIIHAQLSSNHIPNNFDYSYVIDNIPKDMEVSYTNIRPLKDIPLMIGPKAEITSQQLNLTTQMNMIRFIIDGPVYFFLWGEAKYNDIFDGTPQHCTRFCVELHFTNQSGEQTPLMSFSYYGNYNCADEDCKEQS